MPFSKRTNWIVYPLIFAVGYLAGFLGRPGYLSDSAPARDPDFEIRLGTGTYTRPLLDCEVGGYPPGRRELRMFKKELQSLAAGIEKGGVVTQVAIYFRDLDNGPWMGIREEKRFTPASLFKVPLIICCYKQAEDDPSLLDKRLRFNGLSDPALAAQVFAPAETLEVGREYSVRDLMERAAIYSDNGAAELLYQNVDWKIMERVCMDLGVDPAEIFGPVRTLSAETYGRFFRVLYNASYLSRKDSEAVLQLFSRTTFRDGLVAGVPSQVGVSHKFGERGQRPESGGLIQLHDAGIVYHTQRPYLLCVMTEGHNFAAMAAAIAEVSRFVFENVSEQERRLDLQ